MTRCANSRPRGDIRAAANSTNTKTASRRSLHFDVNADQAAARRLRYQASIAPKPASRPGSPAPTMGPGTLIGVKLVNRSTSPAPLSVVSVKKSEPFGAVGVPAKKLNRPAQPGTQSGQTCRSIPPCPTVFRRSTDQRALGSCPMSHRWCSKPTRNDRAIVTNHHKDRVRHHVADKRDEITASIEVCEKRRLVSVGSTMEARRMVSGVVILNLKASKQS
jgi:hypothetical protein